MLIKRLMLPSGEHEEMALLCGAAAVGMPRDCQNFLPFGVFPPKCLRTVDFSDITVFSGGLSGIRTMLANVLCAMLSEDYIALKGMSGDTLCEFCKLCELVYGQSKGRTAFDFLYLSKESVHKYAEKNYALYEEGKRWSVLDCFAQCSEADCFVIVDTPEEYMSFYEQCMLCEELETAVAQHNVQFVLLTNSPVLFGIKNAIIYDFDTNPILPYTWHCSPLVGEYKRYFNTTLERHTYNKKKQTEVHN